MTRPTKRQSAQAAALCAAAAATCVVLTQGSEGLRHKAYLDPAHILTVCYGETHGIDPAKIYSTDQCAELLRRKLASEYAPPILDCIPQLAEPQRVKVFGALLDAAYNAGPGAVCSSRMARSIKAGMWVTGCKGFYGWRATAHDRRTGKVIQLRGLTIRRAKEATMCREGLGNAPVAANRAGVQPPAPVTVQPAPAAVAETWFHRLLRHLGFAR